MISPLFDLPAVSLSGDDQPCQLGITAREGGNSNGKQEVHAWWGERPQFRGVNGN